MRDQLTRRYPEQYPAQLINSFPWWAKGGPILEWPLYAGKDSRGKKNPLAGTGDLKGFITILPMIQKMGYEAVWFTPLYPSALEDRGYDITNYLAVDPAYGSMEDFEHLLEVAHKLGLKILMDLVPGHTSDQHPFFQESQNDPEGPYGDFYIWDKEGERSVFYIDEAGQRRVVRNILENPTNARTVWASDGLKTEAYCWHWNDVRKAYYWHRFYRFQPALNYRNPKVVAMMDDVVRFWLKKGVDGLRVDAVPFLFEEDQTPSEDHPLVHWWIRHVKSLIQQEFPHAMLLCEADLPDPKMRTYVEPGKFDAGFDFQARINMMLAMASMDGSSIENLVRERPTLPMGITWFKQLENHDDMRAEWELQMIQDFLLDFFGNGTRGEKYLTNAVVGGLWPLLDGDAAKIFQIEAIRAILPGVAIDYYRQLIGMWHHPILSLGWGQAKDARDGGRTPFQWNDDANAGFSAVNSKRLYLPVVDGEYPGSYKIVNYEAQRNLPRSPLNQKRRMNILLRNEPLLVFGHAAVLPRRKQENWHLGIVRWFKGIDRAIIGLNNLHATRSSVFETVLPPNLSHLRGSALIDITSGRRVGQLGGRDGMSIEMPIPPNGSWLLAIAK